MKENHEIRMKENHVIRLDRQTNIILFITRLAALENTWVLVSKELYEYLIKKYEHTPIYDGAGMIFYDNFQRSIAINSRSHSRELFWKEVSYISEPNVHLALSDDPLDIYFLS